MTDKNPHAVALGALGGAAGTGDAKRRGGKDHYAMMRAKGVQATNLKRELARVWPDEASRPNHRDYRPAIAIPILKRFDDGAGATRGPKILEALDERARKEPQQ